MTAPETMLAGRPCDAKEQSLCQRLHSPDSSQRLFQKRLAARVGCWQGSGAAANLAIRRHEPLLL